MATDGDDPPLTDRIRGTRRSFLKALGITGAGGAAGVAADTTQLESSTDDDVLAVGGISNVTSQKRRETYVTANPSSFDPSALKENEMFWVSDGEMGVYDGNSKQHFPIGTSSAPVPSVNTEEATTDQAKAVQRLHGLQQANYIREAAGVPSNQPVGHQLTAGLSDSSVLSSVTGYTITSETDASGRASSGSGTESDPYIIKDEDAGQIHWDHSSAGYYIEWRNCRVADNKFIVSTGTEATLKNCEVYNTTGYAIGTFAGETTLQQVHIPGADSAFVDLGSSAKGVTLRNCLLDGTQHAPPSGTEAINLNSSNADAYLDAKYVTIDHSNLRHVVLRDSVDVTLTNWDAKAGERGIWAIPAATVPNITAKYFSSNVNQETIKLIGPGGGHPDDPASDYAVEIAYGDIQSNSASYPLIELAEEANNGDYINGAEIHHLSLTKDGSQNSQQEALRTYVTENVEVHHVAVEDSPDDGVEFFNGLAGNAAHHIWGDTDQSVVDVYRSATYNGDGTASRTGGDPVSTEVHHVYGQSRNREAVSVQECADVLVHHVMAEAPNDAGVRILQGNAANGAVDNIRVFGPLPIAEQTADGPYAESGTLGSNNKVVYMDSETLQDPYGVGGEYTTYR